MFDSYKNFWMFLQTWEGEAPWKKILHLLTGKYTYWYLPHTYFFTWLNIWSIWMKGKSRFSLPLSLSLSPCVPPLLWGPCPVCLILISPYCIHPCVGMRLGQVLSTRFQVSVLLVEVGSVGTTRQGACNASSRHEVKGPLPSLTLFFTRYKEVFRWLKHTPQRPLSVSNCPFSCPTSFFYWLLLLILLIGLDHPGMDPHRAHAHWLLLWLAKLEWNNSPLNKCPNRQTRTLTHT